MCQRVWATSPSTACRHHCCRAASHQGTCSTRPVPFLKWTTSVSDHLHHLTAGAVVTGQRHVSGDIPGGSTGHVLAGGQLTRARRIPRRPHGLPGAPAGGGPLPPPPAQSCPWWWSDQRRRRTRWGRGWGRRRGFTRRCTRAAGAGAGSRAAGKQLRGLHASWCGLAPLGAAYVDIIM